MNKVMQLPLLLLLFRFTLSLSGQVTPIDSLGQLPASASVKEKVALKNKIGTYFNTIKDEEEKNSLAEQYIQIATAKKDSLFLAQGYFQLGDYQYASSSVNQAGRGFGPLLINLLTTQLNGQLEQMTTDGTSTIIRFPLKDAA